MLYEAIIVGIIAVLARFDFQWLGMNMLDRPLTTCTLVGLALGDIQTGLMCGASLEIAFLGVITIGVATTGGDVIIGATLATAFTIISGQGLETAMALAIPISVVVMPFMQFSKIVNTYFAERLHEYVESGKTNHMALYHCIIGPIPTIIQYFTPVFLAILLGSDFVINLINNMPQMIMDGMTIASKLLPAYGFAMLIDMMISKRFIPFFALGFLLYAYAGLGTMATALFACVIAVVYLQLQSKNENNETLDMPLDEEEIL
ncbi:PTS sugar transporter subunit IIC [Erysipelotrichaceae bacterium HCN-30851]